MSDVPNLDAALLDFNSEDWVRFENYAIPSRFTVSFRFNRDTHRWQADFFIGVSELGTPTLLEVNVMGSCKYIRGGFQSSSLLPPYPDLLHGVERWQLKFIEQYRFQLLEMAIAVAIHSHLPTLGNGLPPWANVGGQISAEQLKEITRQIHKKIRQKITPDFLQGVADVYTRAGVNNENPIAAVAERYQCSHRTAQEYATKARRLKYLPPTTQGKVTVRKPTKRKRDS